MDDILTDNKIEFHTRREDEIAKCIDMRNLHERIYFTNCFSQRI